MFIQSADPILVQSADHIFAQSTNHTTAHRICRNANLVSSVLCASESHINVKSACSAVRRFLGLEGPTPLTRTGQEDFIRACYRAMTIAAENRCSISHPISHSTLEPLDMLEYMQMREAMRFLAIFHHKDPASSYERARSISVASVTLNIFHCSLMRLPCVHRWPLHACNCCGAIPHSYFTLAEPTRGKRLAELLPLIEKQDRVLGISGHALF